MGVKVVSSTVKTVECTFLNQKTLAVEPSELNISVILGDVLIFELIYCQKALGLESTFCFMIASEISQFIIS